LDAEEKIIKNLLMPRTQKSNGIEIGLHCGARVINLGSIFALGDSWPTI
jgi:hypothetical protein